MVLILNKNKKSGFTLVELILVMAVLALLGTIALNMYFDSTKSFTFFLNYKSLRSNMRQARSFAMSNTATKGTVPDNYGIAITNDVVDGKDVYKILLFADDDIDSPMKYTEDDTTILGKEYFIGTDNYQLDIYAQTGLGGDLDLLDLPVEFYYETGTGDFSGFHKGNAAADGLDLIPKRSDNYIDILLQDKANDNLKRHLVINQVSGLSEEYVSTTLENR